MDLRDFILKPDPIYPKEHELWRINREPVWMDLKHQLMYSLKYRGFMADALHYFRHKQQLAISTLDWGDFAAGIGVSSAIVQWLLEHEGWKLMVFDRGLPHVVWQVATDKIQHWLELHNTSMTAYKRKLVIIPLGKFKQLIDKGWLPVYWDLYYEMEKYVKHLPMTKPEKDEILKAMKNIQLDLL
jgi:hypothetical protein